MTTMTAPINWHSGEVHIFAMRGGGRVWGKSPEDIVSALRRDSEAWIPTRSEAAFKRSMAKRCREYDRRALIRTDSDEHFVEDLVKHGFLTDVPPEWTEPKPENVVPFHGESECGEDE